MTRHAPTILTYLAIVGARRVVPFPHTPQRGKIFSLMLVVPTPPVQNQITRAILQNTLQNLRYYLI